MHIDIFTLFPGMFAGPFDESIIKRAQEARLASIAIHNIRDWAPGKHHQCDDTPYGGGGGMVIKPEPVFYAVEAVLGIQPGEPPSIPIILLTAVGEAVPSTKYTHADGMSTEADEYIPKPIETEGLWGAVTSLL